MTSKRWALLFFMTALVVYTPGIWWGLPDGTAPGRHAPWGTDELAPVGAINELYGVFAARNPTFNPQYPLFHYFSQFVFVAPYYAGLWLTGHLSQPAPSFPYGFDHPPAELGVMTLLARFVSLLMAAGVVAIAFRTGEILRNRRTGILAGAFVLLQYPMFYYSRTSNVDMGALFWTALGLLVFAACMENGLTIRRGLGLGAAAALAVASKDASYGAFLPVGAVVLLLHVRTVRRSGGSWGEALRVPVYSGVLAVALYAACSGLLFRPARYFQHVDFITHGPMLVPFRQPATPEGYVRLTGELVMRLADAMGWPMFLCAAVGVALWLAYDQRLALVTLPAAGLIAGVIVPARFLQLRFVMVVAYVLAFSAADLIARGLARPRALPRSVAVVAVVMIVAAAGIRGTDLTYQMLRDSRYTAANWLRNVIRPSDRVGHFALAHNLPSLPPGVRTASLRPDRLLTLADGDAPEFIISMPLQDFEPLHEQSLADSMFDRLLDGSLGYRQAALIQTPSLFRRRPASFVNPPVRIFIRADLWADRLANR